MLKPLEGKTFCITGALSRGTRTNYIDFIESLGGTYNKSVSKNTMYLITNETAGTIKYDKAKELGTSILSEEDFHTLIGTLEKISLWKSIVEESKNGK